MQSLRETILSTLSKTGYDDNAQVAALSRIAQEHGMQTFPVLLHILTQLEMDEDEAELCWHEIIRHRAQMTEALKRPVNLRTALCDYFSGIYRRLKNPKIVEMEVFEKNAASFRSDSLTGLFSRAYFDETLERELSRSRRYDTDLSLLFLDLDDFKRQNDTYGHPAGDRLLKDVARIIRDQIRSEDAAARYGGDELVIIMPHTGKRSALCVGERIRAKVASLQSEYDGVALRQTISGGLASFPLDGRDSIELVRSADIALYQAKHGGKNKIVLYSGHKVRYLQILA